MPVAGEERKLNLRIGFLHHAKTNLTLYISAIKRQNPLTEALNVEVYLRHAGLLCRLEQPEDLESF